ncbi:hypothetical protein L249_2878 [Ophiocordyceps polyrhachis-furcata BCC 54312]|uniref:Uncharacterized protein n=1 Tax=Ophiocordyceps polyrhachis-furcata BCC 54312 TaxID=1330021 RepID=A0A367LQG1_9HYPO|nr:hypothetical protein L249_2878 [Ophiocordyceps polyrhachis-furcata BCC 54312]
MDAVGRRRLVFSFLLSSGYLLVLHNKAVSSEAKEDGRGRASSPSHMQKLRFTPFILLVIAIE